MLKGSEDRGRQIRIKLLPGSFFKNFFQWLALFVSLFSFSQNLFGQQGYANFGYWNRSRVYSFTVPSYQNEFENILHLDIWQKTVNYGIFRGWFDGRVSSSNLEAAHWYLSWEGLQAGRLSFNLQLGDNHIQLTKLGYRFTNYYPAYNYLRGLTAGFKHKKFSFDFFSGRVARLTGLLGNFYSLTEQTATGFMAHYEPEKVYYLGFGFIHSENERDWSGELLTRVNHLLVIESELRFSPEVRFVMDTRASEASPGDGDGKVSGTSIRFGPIINRNGWSLEINYRRVEKEFRNLNSEYFYDRDQEGLFAAWRFQPKRSLFIFGSFDYYHDNVDRLPEINTTDFLRLYSGFSLVSPPWPDLTLRLDFTAAESRRHEENYHHYLSPGFYLQLSKNLGAFYPYLRVRFQHYDNRVDDSRDFTYPSYYLGLRYSYFGSSYLLLEVEDTRYFDYQQNKRQAYNRVRLAHYSPFFLGTDFYGEFSYADIKSWYFASQVSRQLELYLGLGRKLPLGFKARVDFRAQWPLDSTLPASYWVTLRLDRRFNWGEAPAYQGRTSGPALTGTGRIEGLIFSDHNLNGLYDSGEKVFTGITLTLEDGSQVTSDRNGRFMFSRVAEGVHTVNLEVRDIPAEFYLLGLEKRQVLVEKRKTTGVIYALVESVSLSGLVFEDTNKNGKLDAEDRRLKDVLVVMKPVPAPSLPESLEKMRTEELTCYTDDHGKFFFENILPGPYELFVDEASLPRGLKLQTELPLKIQLRPGEKIEDVKIIYLPRPIIFSGQK